MTARRPMLCADAASLQHPEVLGLEGERLDAQDWLCVFSDAEQARTFARTCPQGLEVWVAGSDQMEGINLAAAMKRDRADANVCLLSFASGGSLLSRARAAGIDAVLDRGAFLSRYRSSKQAHVLQVPFTQAAGQVPAPSEDGRPAPRHAAGAQVAPAQAAPSGMAAGARHVASGYAGPAVAHAPVAAVDARVVQPNVQVPAATGVMPGAVAAQDAKGYLITVVGAGGGTGKSTVSTLIACCAQESGRKTVVVDADLQFGDIAYLTGSESPLRIDDLVEAPLRVEGLAKTGRMPAVVAAPDRMERGELAQEHLMEVLNLLRQRFDVVVVNTGPSWSDLHVQLMEASSNVLFVVDQRPSSIRACKHALDLCARCGIASKPFLFAVNRCSRKALFSSIDVSCALQGVHVHELQDGGKAVEELLGTGQPLDLIDSGNALAKSVAVFVEEVLPQADAAAPALAMPQKKRGLRVGRRRS